MHAVVGRRAACPSPSSERARAAAADRTRPAASPATTPACARATDERVLEVEPGDHRRLRALPSGGSGDLHAAGASTVGSAGRGDGIGAPVRPSEERADGAATTSATARAGRRLVYALVGRGATWARRGGGGVRGGARRVSRARLASDTRVSGATSRRVSADAARLGARLRGCAGRAVSGARRGRRLRGGGVDDAGGAARGRRPGSSCSRRAETRVSSAREPACLAAGRRGWCRGRSSGRGGRRSASGVPNGPGASSATSASAAAAASIIARRGLEALVRVLGQAAGDDGVDLARQVVAPRGHGRHRVGDVRVQQRGVGQPARTGTWPVRHS